MPPMFGILPVWHFPRLYINNELKTLSLRPVTIMEAAKIKPLINFEQTEEQLEAQTQQALKEFAAIEVKP